MKKILSILLACIGFTVGVQAQDSDGISSEEWRCFDESDFLKKTVLITLQRITVDGKTHGIGRVSVAGITYTASFKVIGFDRRWNFGEVYEYTFIIKPDGSGLYYDFSDIEVGGKTSPNQFYACELP